MLTKEEQVQKEYYNNIASVYDQHAFDTLPLQYRFRIFDEILKGVDINGMKVLDAMCGGGQNTAYLDKVQCTVSAIDISEEQCKIYQQRFPKNEVKPVSILDTGYKSNTFDLVMINGLHHAQPKVNEALTEICRIIKPGGYLLMWEPNADSLMDIFRKIWYLMDKKYFQNNEESISIPEILKHNKAFVPLKIKYGGSFEYLLVNQSMLFRISPKLIPYYASFLRKLETVINCFGKMFSCWGLALLQKKA